MSSSPAERERRRGSIGWLEVNPFGEDNGVASVADMINQIPLRDTEAVKPLRKCLWELVRWLHSDFQTYVATNHFYLYASEPDWVRDPYRHNLGIQSNLCQGIRSMDLKILDSERELERLKSKLGENKWASMSVLVPTATERMEQFPSQVIQFWKNHFMAVESVQTILDVSNKSELGKKFLWELKVPIERFNYYMFSMVFEITELAIKDLGKTQVERFKKRKRYYSDSSDSESESDDSLQSG